MLHPFHSRKTDCTYSKKFIQVSKEVTVSDNICYASVGLQYFLGSCCFDNNYNYLATHEKTGQYYTMC